MKLTTIINEDLSRGTDLACEVAEITLSTYGGISARSADGVTVNMRTTPQAVAEAIVDWVRSARYCDGDSERSQVIRAALGRLEATLAESLECLQAHQAA